MQLPLVSVIIPCYNQGAYIQEAIDSVLGQNYSNYEIIIVDDGSDDPLTKEILNNIHHDVIKLVHTSNQGLANARNTGIEKSKGTYILPLDADDKIENGYLQEAAEIFKKDERCIIVYGKAILFGDAEGAWKLEEFKLENMLQYNLIYASALFRRDHYSRTKGYDVSFKVGWEDWDFWLSLIEIGGNIHYINKVCFHYRIRKDSMVRRMTEKQMQELRLKIYCKHAGLYKELFSDPIGLYRNYKYYKVQYEKLTSSIWIKTFMRLKRYLSRNERS